MLDPCAGEPDVGAQNSYSCVEISIIQLFSNVCVAHLGDMGFHYIMIIPTLLVSFWFLLYVFSQRTSFLLSFRPFQQWSFYRLLWFWCVCERRWAQVPSTLPSCPRFKFLVHLILSFCPLLEGPTPAVTYICGLRDLDLKSFSDRGFIELLIQWFSHFLAQRT